MSNSDLCPVISPVAGVCVYATALGDGKKKSNNIKCGDKILQIRAHNTKDERNDIVDVTATCSGTLFSIEFVEGDEIHQGSIVAYIEPCKHPALYGVLCVSCGDAITTRDVVQTSKEFTILPTNGLDGISSLTANSNDSFPTKTAAIGSSNSNVDVDGMSNTELISASSISINSSTSSSGKSGSDGRISGKSTESTDSVSLRNMHSTTLTFAGGKRLQLSEEEAVRVQKLKTSALRSISRLALVLDLDHTLVHATAAWYVLMADEIRCLHL
jgi:pyruvate/2-oxoglutarate dehydrogenase complex dihydrolipoamide acyltransferase (E2) component